jgi:hypothetical protein
VGQRIGGVGQAEVYEALFDGHAAAGGTKRVALAIPPSELWRGWDSTEN